MGRGHAFMITFIFILGAAIIVIGFVVWVVSFGGMKRRGQSGQAEVTAAQVKPAGGRASGLD